MGGGLLNLVGVGSQNVILNGNPKTSFFKNVYKKYTNFGLQKFRIDYDGQRVLRYNTESVFDFKIPRYAELVMDSYIVVNLPNIWSPVIPPRDCNGIWLPYEFRWIDNVGWHMIKEIEIYVGNQTLQKFSGEYMLNMAKRDFSGDKKQLVSDMVGNVKEFNDPANFSTNNGYYPNAYYTPLKPGAEPSIRGRKLYIPINSWFTLTSRLAFPLVCLQYNELHVRVTFRPVRELFKIRDVDDNVTSGESSEDFISTYYPNKFWNLQLGNESNGKYKRSKYWGYPIQEIPLVAPDTNNPWHAFYRFLQPPPSADVLPSDYANYGTTKVEWNADVHIISTYCFLSNDEIRLFASSPQQYLIKEVREREIHRVVGSYKVEMDSHGLVSDWMFYLKRSDVNLRNEWDNYTNWGYSTKPYGLFSLIPSFGSSPIIGAQQTASLNPITHTATWTGNGSQYMDPSNLDYTSNILGREQFYKELASSDTIEPIDAINAITNSGSSFEPTNDETIAILKQYGLISSSNLQLLPGVNPNGSCEEAGKSNDKWSGWLAGGVIPYPYSPIKITGNYSTKNQRGILLSTAILLDGKYREQLFDQGVYNYIDKYTRAFSGSFSDNLYCYNFCTNASYIHPSIGLSLIQPTGAINLSKFSKVELEMNTYVPPLDPQAQTTVICDGSGNAIGINKSEWEIYEYTYNLHIIESRFNVVIFESGNCSLQYAR